MRKRIALFLALALTPAVAQVPAANSSPSLQTVGQLGNNLFLASGTTGMVIVVVRGDQVFFQGYGQTAPASGQVPTQDSVIRLCSLTKIFTADLLNKLALDKTVQFDDPLQKYAPPHTVVPRHEKPITLRNLATHTSGLPRELANAPKNTPHFTYPDYATRWRWLRGQHLNTTPGTAALYSNLAFDYLGDALQTAAHKPYAALLAERTLNPLNMRQTTYYPNPVQCGRLLQGTHDQGPCTITDETAGSSGLYSTPADMAVWLKYLLGTGAPSLPAQDPSAQAELIPISSLKSEKGLDHAGQPTGIGLGWIYLQGPENPSHIVQKTGGGAGFSTYIAINQSRKTAIFLAATDGDGESHVNIFKEANSIVLAMAGLPPLPPDPPKPTKPVAKRKHTSKRQRPRR